jgi:hypothetical protein
MSSEALAYGLRRNADDVVPRPAARIGISVRPIEPRDVHLLFEQEIEKSNGQSRIELVRRHQFYQLGTPTGFVAVTDEDEPCYMQWLVTEEHNDTIERYFDGLFPALEPGQGLLEMAFTLQKFRRNRIMAEAMARIAEAGFERGLKEIITFVGVDNISSLKGCKLAGFAPYTLRSEKWNLFQRSISFGPVHHGLPGLDVFTP